MSAADYQQQKAVHTGTGIPTTSTDCNNSGSCNNSAAVSSTSQHHQPHYYDADFSWFGQGDTYAKRVAKYCYPTAIATLNGMEWVGEKVVNLFGLNQSRFQYAVDEYERQERKRLYREQQAIDARIEAYRLKGLRDGMNDDDEDISDIPYVPPIVSMPPSLQDKGVGGAYLPHPSAVAGGSR